MIRSIKDFLSAWEYESDATLKQFAVLTDASLAQRVIPEGRTLGRLAWHIALSPGEMLRTAGIPFEGPPDDAPVPASAREIHDVYKKAAEAVTRKLPEAWTDAMLPEMIPMYGRHWPRSMVLSSLLAHQTHHRGQMTVLMRQAGLRVPGVYGPAKEEWAAMDLPPQE